MVSIDATFLIQLINFLFLMFVLNKIFFQPILKIQAERQTAIEGAQKTTQSKIAELKQMRDDYQHKLEQSRQEAYDLVSEQINQANQVREAQLQEVQSEIDARLNQAKEQLASQEAELRQSLANEVAPIAELIFGKLTQPSSEAKQEVNV